MERALRIVTVERGHDPRGLALVAFGGAGPLHACQLAEELGSDRRVPEAAGVLSALGLAAERRAAGPRRSYVCPLPDAGELPREATPTCAIAAVVRAHRSAGGRPCGALPGAHEERYGYADPTGRSSWSPSAPPTSARPGDLPPPARRSRIDAPPARDWSSSPAQRAGSPPGGWGLGMVSAGS